MAAITNDALARQALAQDQVFIRRVKANLANCAWQVLNEDAATAGHVARAAYARQVIQDLEGYAFRTAKWLVERTNLIATTLDLSLDNGVSVLSTNASDGAIQSQIMSDWSLVAGA